MLKSIFACLVFMFISASSSASAQSSYAEDRAMIEDLQARYLFALDFGDADAFASTFTDDGVLNHGRGETIGREALRNFILEDKKRAETQRSKDTSGLRPAAGRHNISNIVIKVSGNKAVGRAYWFHMNNNNAKRTAELDSFGHYEDELMKVNGQWLFSKRKVYNEQLGTRASTGGNPAW